jgi:hypothetical protein
VAKGVVAAASSRIHPISATAVCDMLQRHPLCCAPCTLLCALHDYHGTSTSSAGVDMACERSQSCWLCVCTVACRSWAPTAEQQYNERRSGISWWNAVCLVTSIRDELAAAANQTCAAAKSDICPATMQQLSLLLVWSVQACIGGTQAREGDCLS